MQKNNETRCGYVAIVGKPNVGKSTLLNHILGKKLSITSRKPQTTRHRILGIKTLDDAQIIFVDTPGMHKTMPRQMNRYMNRIASGTLRDVDVVLFVIDATSWDGEDEAVAKLMMTLEKPVFLVINKIDKLRSREDLLPLMQRMHEQFHFAKVIPVSALANEQLEALLKAIVEVLPENAPYYPPEQFTDRSHSFVASEILREKLTRFLGEELPYALTVTIESFKDEEKIIRIAALIWVERDGQKAIVIGKDGAALKKIAASARKDMEIFFDKKVFLQVWVKVKSGWSDDKKSLAEFGYD